MELSKSSRQNTSPIAERILPSVAPTDAIFRQLIDAVEDYAIFALDANGYILTWNLGAERVKGYKPEEVIGSHFSRFYAKEDTEKQHPDFELEQAKEKGKYEEEGWRVRKDGTKFWANVVITALRDENGKLRGFGKVTRDITRRREAETKLRESEERFRLMVEGVTDYAIFMLDPKGNVATWNKGAEHNKGYSEKEIIGQHFSKFYPEVDVKNGKPAQQLQEAIQSGRFEDEGWCVRKDGTKFWANMLITPVFDRNGVLIGFSKVTRNLTERKKSEDALRQAYAELEQRVEDRTKELSRAKTKAERAVKARDQFFSIASHELKTPLTSLKLQVQLRKRAVMRGDISKFAPQRLLELCEDDEKQVGRLIFLVDNMFDISRLTSGTFELVLENFELSEILQDVCKRMSPLLKNAGVDCIVSAPTKVHGAWDRNRLEQVMMNLLANVVKYAPGAPVEMTLTVDSQKATISVRDHGKGVPKLEQDRIFQAFERIKGKADVTSLGLGLFIVRQIIEAHHGCIRIESELNQGTNFIIELPLNMPTVIESN